jgi:hypothetical protein
MYKDDKRDVALQSHFTQGSAAEGQRGQYYLSIN